QREVRGIEDVLAAHTQSELAGDGDHGGEYGHVERSSAQQQAQRKPGDERAARIEASPAGQALTRELGGEGSRDERHHVRLLDFEIQPPDPVNEEAAEGGDLVEPWVPASGRAFWRRSGSRRRPGDQGFSLYPADEIHASLDRPSTPKFPNARPGKMGRFNPSRRDAARAEPPHLIDFA